MFLSCISDKGEVEGYAAFSIALFQFENVIIFVVLLNSVYVHPVFKNDTAWAALSLGISRFASAALEAIYLDIESVTVICPVLFSHDNNKFNEHVKKGVITELNSGIDYIVESHPNPNVKINNFGYCKFD